MFTCLDHLSIRFIYKCIYILIGCFCSDVFCIVKVKIVWHIVKCKVGLLYEIIIPNRKIH